MSQHPRLVVGFDGSMDQIAEAIGNMKYDQVAVVIGALAKDLDRQADGDAENGRVQLVSQIQAVKTALREAREYVDRAWKICEPHM